MEVSAELRITGTRAAVWAVASDVEGWARIVQGVRGIEIVTRPATGLTGLRWKETRLLFDKPETVEKWVTESVDQEFFTSRAEQDGFVFTTSLRLTEQGGGVLVTSTHRTDTQTLGARLRALPLFLFKGMFRKVILADLQDFKTAVEGAPSRGA
jgi:hypothetical protein